MSIPLTAGSSVWNTAKFCFPELACKIYICRKPRTLSRCNNIGSRNVVDLNLFMGQIPKHPLYESFSVLHGRTTSQKPTTAMGWLCDLGLFAGASVQVALLHADVFGSRKWTALRAAHFQLRTATSWLKLQWRPSPGLRLVWRGYKTLRCSMMMSLFYASTSALKQITAFAFG